MVRFLAGRWAPWIATTEVGPGRLYFWWLQSEVDRLKRSEGPAGGQDEGCHGEHSGVSLRAVSGRSAGDARICRPHRETEVDPASPLLRATPPRHGA